MSRTAQIGVKASNNLGSTWINLTYWSDNTWYCPSPGNIGSSSGTWDVVRGVTGSLANISLSQGDDMIASASGFALAELVGYPFNEDFMNKISKFECLSQDAAWYIGSNLQLGVGGVFNCSYWFNKF